MPGKKQNRDCRQQGRESSPLAVQMLHQQALDNLGGRAALRNGRVAQFVVQATGQLDRVKICHAIKTNIAPYPNGQDQNLRP